MPFLRFPSKVPNVPMDKTPPNSPTPSIPAVTKPKISSGLIGVNVSLARLLVAQNCIKEACEPIIKVENSLNHDDLVEIASKVAVQTKTVCDTCKTAVGRCHDLHLKRQYIDYTKEIARASTKFIEAIRNNLQNTTSTSDIFQLTNATQLVLSTVDQLVDFVKKSASPVLVEQQSTCDVCKKSTRVGGGSIDSNLRFTYVELAKDVADQGNELVQIIKKRQQDWTSRGDIVALSKSIYSVLNSVHSLVDFAKYSAASTVEPSSPNSKTLPKKSNDSKTTSMTSSKGNSISSNCRFIQFFFILISVP